MKPMNLNVYEVSAYKHQQLTAIRHKAKQVIRHNIQIAGELIEYAGDRVQAQLKDGLLDIASSQSQLHIDKRQSQEEIGNRLADILEKKENMLKQLQIIKQNEEQLKSVSKLNESRATTSNSHFKSELTAEDLEKWRSLKLQGQKLEKQLQERTQQYELRMKKIKQDEEHAKQALYHAKHEMRKRETQKTIDLIQKRKAQRQARLQQENRAIRQIVQRKKLHNQWHDKWKTVEEEQEKKRQQILNQIKQMRKISHEQIRKHEQKYNETMKTQKESRLKQLNNASHISLDYSYRSVFLDKIMEDDRRLKELEDLKKNESKQFLHKIKEYGQRVKLLYRPTMKPKAIEQQNTQTQLRSLSLFETHQLGNEYMKTVNSELASAFKQRSMNHQQVQIEEPTKKYKNYLKQLKKSKNSGEGHRMSEMNQLKILLQKQNLAQEQKLYQVKLIADKLDGKTYIKSPTALVNNINAKIQILRHIDR